MQEYQDNANRTDILNTKKIRMEQLAAQGAPVSKLVTHHLAGQIPANKQACEETANRQHYLSCKEVEQIEQRAAAYLHKVPFAQ